MIPGVGSLLLVGAGKMGGALLERWVAGDLDAGQVTVLDPHLESGRSAEFQNAGVTVAASAAEAAARAHDVIVIALKPQSAAEVLPQIAPLAAPQTIVVSIMAGIRLSRLEAAFAEGQPIVRTMPNTPVQIGRGMTVAVPNRHVSESSRQSVDALLSAGGRVAWVADETMIDTVTAVSGSGPAYVFLLAECLAEAGRQAGLPADLADLLGRETVSGAGALLASSELPPSTLRRNVTSPGGTTEAGLAVLMAPDGLQQLVARAVAAAKQRSRELG